MSCPNGKILPERFRLSSEANEPRPLCRDCADNAGICPHDGTPCVPYVTKLRKFAELRRRFPGKRPVVDGDFTHACEIGAMAIEQRDELLSAVWAILQSTRGDSKGEQWTIRRWLNDRGVFNDDIQGSKRLVEAVCKFAFDGATK